LSGRIIAESDFFEPMAFSALMTLNLQLPHYRRHDAGHRRPMALFIDWIGIGGGVGVSYRGRGVYYLLLSEVSCA